MQSALRLRRMRIGLNLSHEKMATIVKLPTQTYIRAEAGTREVDPRWWPWIVLQIASYLDETSPESQ